MRDPMISTSDSIFASDFRNNATRLEPESGFAIPPPPAEQDNETNVWVESYLRESAGDRLQFGDVTLDPERRMVSCQGRRARFSPLDFALLLVLARNTTKMVSYARIFRRLWGPSRKVSVPLMRVRVFRVRQKLEAERMYGIRIANRLGFGYVLEIDSATSNRKASSKQANNVYRLPEPAASTSRPVAAEYVRRRLATAAE